MGSLFRVAANLYGSTKYCLGFCIDKSPKCLLDALKYSYLMKLYD